jgi:hypothetical protein
MLQPCEVEFSVVENDLSRENEKIAGVADLSQTPFEVSDQSEGDMAMLLYPCLCHILGMGLWQCMRPLSVQVHRL